MLHSDIEILERRQKALEEEIDQALSHWSIDDPMIADLKYRVLYIKEQIHSLRNQVISAYR